MPECGVAAMNQPDKEAVAAAARDEDIKAALKEALKEWLDEKFTSFGKWSFGTLAVLLLGAFVYFILWSQGWHKP